MVEESERGPVAAGRVADGRAGAPVDAVPCFVGVGAGPGIGAATASLFAARGWRTVLVARSAGTLDAVAAAVASAAPGAPAPVTLSADGADPPGLRAALAGLALPRVDVAHFNLSRWVPGGADSDLDAVRGALDVGAVAALAMVQALLPALSAPGRRGTVLFTGGGTADRPMPASLALGLQKAALRNLALGLAAELRPQVHVATLTVSGTVAPGTPFAAEVVAARLAALADETAGDPASWTVVGDMRG